MVYFPRYVAGNLLLTDKYSESCCYQVIILYSGGNFISNRRKEKRFILPDGSGISKITTGIINVIKNTYLSKN
jgi:hypothetical protein